MRTPSKRGSLTAIPRRGHRPARAHGQCDDAQLSMVNDSLDDDVEAVAYLLRQGIDPDDFADALDYDAWMREER